MLKVGRYTAALVLVIVGGAVVSDKLAGTGLTAELVKIWPMLFIMLGLEYILFNMRHGRGQRPLKLDLGGIIFSVAVAAVIIVSVQNPGVWQGIQGIKGLGSTNIASVIEAFSDDGKSFDKGTTVIPAGAEIKQIKLTNTNGKLRIKPGNVPQIEVELTVYVNSDKEEEAASIAEASRLEHRISGETLEISTVPAEYGFKLFGKRKPRMDLIVTVPAELRADWDVSLTNGQIEASKLLLQRAFTAEGVNAEILVREMVGTISLKATNGQLKTQKTEGSLSMEVSNGILEAADHTGGAKLKSTNGESTLSRHSGDVDIEIANGAIQADGNLKRVRTEGASASVKLRTSQVEGDWDVTTKHGKVELMLPAAGSYTFEGTGGFGSMHTELPFQISKTSMTGTLGSGTYKVHAATKGALSVQRVN
ncbi:DUF4097 family beta strand repeat-containing protein [Paenibacillus filicis]|uniref:DUF4097 family beta strand repeat-containing protein n=1 Tax=Paenibacillus filicis TaxID=669464 RepID=A0ABU9DTP9_9BACL